MNVEDAVGGNVQGRLRKDLAVGGDDEYIPLSLSELCNKISIDLFGLQYLDAMLERPDFFGREYYFLAVCIHGVLPGYDKRRQVSGRLELIKNSLGERCGAEESESYAWGNSFHRKSEMRGEHLFFFGVVIKFDRAVGVEDGIEVVHLMLEDMR